MELNKYIDHTILKADACQSDIEMLCKEALEYDFMAVCINPYWLSYARTLLKNSDVKLCTVINFPLGSSSKKACIEEGLQAINDGANELDIVMNIGALKSKLYQDVELGYFVEAMKEHKNDVVIKVIIETSLLTKEEKIKACEIVLEAKADFVKTSTGFSNGGASIEDIKLIKSIVRDKALIKASGGIKDKLSALAMIEAGANRIGTSNGIKIVTE